MSYRIDHKQVARLGAEAFGILGGITSERVKRRLQPNGRYNIRENHNAQVTTFLRSRGGAEYVHHHIRVEGQRPPAEVAESIAHELQHAQQAERIIRTTTEQKLIEPVLAYFNTGEYWHRECEVEAREAGRIYGTLVEGVAIK